MTPRAIRPERLIADWKGKWFMPHKITAKEFESVSKLAAPQRYGHFIKRVADWQEVWGMRGPDGWVGMGDDQGRKGISLWPHPDYASAMATGDWAACKPGRIELADLLDKWLTGMARDGVFAVVFPTASMKGIVVEPLRLKDDLMAECEKYGDDEGE